LRVTHPSDYADYDANLHDDDYWNNDFTPDDGEDYKEAEEDAGSLYDSYDSEYEDDETENFESSLGSWALYKLMPSKSCLDPTVA
jgi:hypothetical protein